MGHSAAPSRPAGTSRRTRRSSSGAVSRRLEESQSKKLPDDRQCRRNEALPFLGGQVEGPGGVLEHLAQRAHAVEVGQQRHGVPIDADGETQALGQLERLALDREPAVADDDGLVEAVGGDEREPESEHALVVQALEEILGGEDAQRVPGRRLESVERKRVGADQFGALRRRSTTAP